MNIEEIMKFTEEELEQKNLDELNQFIRTLTLEKSLQELTSEEKEQRANILKTIRSKLEEEKTQTDSLPSNDAYWIDRIGRIYQLKTTGSANDPEEHHISFIVNNPDLFGYTEKDLQKMFDEFDERELMYKDGGRGEGKARDKIVRQVIQEGWIRIRRYLNKRRQMLGYTINLGANSSSQIPKKQQRALRKWSNWILEKAPTRKSDMINFDFLSGQEMTNLKELSLFYFPEADQEDEIDKKSIFENYLKKVNTLP